MTKGIETRGMEWSGNLSAAENYLAKTVRRRLEDLRAAIVDCQECGVTVEVPELVHLYLTSGTASGAPADWKIYKLL